MVAHQVGEPDPWAKIVRVQFAGGVRVAALTQVVQFLRLQVENCSLTVRKTPIILSIEQIKAFLSHLEEPCRTAVFLDVSSGLRVGELLGLKWEDVDFESLEVNVTRSVVKQKITRCKTEASRKPVPLDPDLAEVLLNWKLQCPYPEPGDWVFASPHKKGKQPYWPGALFRAHLQPALKASGIPGNVGWHTLRHTFGTLMKANGEDMKTIQELLRHSNFKVTADTYTQAVTVRETGCATKLVKMFLPAKAAAEEF